MINKVILIGRLVKDAEISQTSSGIPYTRFTIAVAKQYVSSGDNQTDFVPIVSWRNTANFVANYTRKGSLIAVEGRFSSYSYVDANSNQRVTRYEIVADNIETLETKQQFDKRLQQQSSYSTPNSNSGTHNDSPLTFANDPGNNNYSQNDDFKEPENNNNEDTDNDLPWEIEI